MYWVELEKDVKDGDKSRDDLKARLEGEKCTCILYMHSWCGGIMGSRTMTDFFIWDNKT